MAIFQFAILTSPEGNKSSNDPWAVTGSDHQRMMRGLESSQVIYNKVDSIGGSPLVLSNYYIARKWLTLAFSIVDDFMYFDVSMLSNSGCLKPSVCNLSTKWS